MATGASALENCPIPLHDRELDSGGVRLHYVEAGEGPLVVLLHGFPEFWYAWRRQIAPLALAGFRVVALDMRGYNLSEKPTDVRSYGTRTLVEDVARLVRACGEKTAFIVGHDWGAGVAWAFAMAHPEMTTRLAVLNGPHPERLLAAMRSPEQLAKSWYMFFFQLPWLPEAVAKLDDYELFIRSLREEPTVPGAVTPYDLGVYRESYAIPGALSAMLDYYRAMFRPGTAPKLARVEAETLVIWGEDDPHLGRELATPPSDRVPHARVEYIAHASHWVQHEQPKRVNELLIAFLTS